MTTVPVTAGASSPGAAPERAGHRWALPLAAALVVLLVPALPAAAEEHPQPSVRLAISAFQGVLGDGSVPAVDMADHASADVPPPAMDLRIRALVENPTDVPVDQLRLVVEVFGPVASRTQLHAAFDGAPGIPVHVHDLPVRDGGAIQPGQIAGVEARFTPDEVAWAADGGVHPVRIAIVRGTEVLDETVTAAIWLDHTPVAPLRTVMTWPLTDVPHRLPGGRYAQGTDRTLAPGGRIDGLLRPLERVADAGVVVAPALHVLEELAERANGFTAQRSDGAETTLETIEPEDPQARLANTALQRIRAATRTQPAAPITTTYADVDLPGLLANGDRELQELASRAASDGVRRLRLLLEREPDAATHLVTGPLVPGALDLISASHILLPADTVVAAPVTPSEPVRPLRSAAGRTLTGIVGDPWLAHAVSEPDLRHGEAVAVQRVLASSAMAMFEAPETPDRALAILPDVDWSPTPSFATSILDGLTSATWLELSSPGDIAATARRSATEIVLADVGDPELTASLRTALARSHRDLAAAVSMLPDGDALLGGHRSDELRDTLLHASSRSLHGIGQGRAEQLVRDVDRAVSDAFGVVDVDGSRVTLTSDRGQIPVTVHRASGGPALVRIEVASQGRLAWPEGDVAGPVLLEPDGRSTIAFATRALSTGTFPVTVRVTDPSGRHELSQTTIPVRSTAISQPALIATGGLVVALLVIGAVRRGTRRPRLAVIRPTGEPTP